MEEGELTAAETRLVNLYVYLCGDANSDTKIDVAGVMYLWNYLFINGPMPEPLEAGDANCDGLVDIRDAVYLINYLFIGGPLPSC